MNLSILDKIPDKIVRDDIIHHNLNFELYYKSKKPEDFIRKGHNFTHICNGKILSPNLLINYSSEREIILYSGGLGMGYYLGISYNIENQMYIYYAGEQSTYNKYKSHFCSSNWNEMYEYVTNILQEYNIK